VEPWQKIRYDLPERQPLYDGGRIVYEEHHRGANLAARNTLGVHPMNAVVQHARLSEPLDALLVQRTVPMQTQSIVRAPPEMPRPHWPFPLSQTLLVCGAALLYATLRYRRDIEERAKVDFYLEHVIHANPAAYLYPITKPEER
jgi:hypothetical protein